MNAFEQVLLSKAKTKAEPGDYTGEDGLLYCGKCNMPKQKKIELSDGIRAVPILCRCETEKDEAEARKKTAEDFMAKMKHQWEDGISCPDALRYSFSEDDAVNESLSKICRRYVERWEEMRADNIGLLLYGSVGTGKSFYASCIGNGLLDKQVSVAATNFPRLLNLLQGTQDKQKLLDRLRLYSLFIVDDLGVERDSTYAAEQIFNVIDARASSKLPLVVTTNLTLEELEKPESMQYARIYDRVLELCPVRLKMIGKSRRSGNADRRKEKARELLLS